MLNLLTRKLENFARQERDECLLLDSLLQEVRTIGSRMDLICEGDTPSDVHLILDGFACRYKLLPNGTRQIPRLHEDHGLLDRDAFPVQGRQNIAIANTWPPGASRNCTRTLVGRVGG